MLLGALMQSLALYSLLFFWRDVPLHLMVHGVHCQLCIVLHVRRTLLKLCTAAETGQRSDKRERQRAWQQWEVEGAVQAEGARCHGGCKQRQRLREAAL